MVFKRSCTHTQKKKRERGVEGRAMCRVQPLYIKNWGEKRKEEKSYNT